LVEAIDLVATFIDAAGGDVPKHIVEGRSLVPLLNGETPQWREVAVSEFDYSPTPQGMKLGLEPSDCRLFMVFDGRYKLMHAMGGFRPMLFDLETDPDELDDLAKGDAHDAILDQMYAHLAHWGRRNAQRVTKSDEDIKNMRGKSLRKGILPFLVDGSEVPDELLAKYSGPAAQRFVDD
jgi:arylsulfatase A-like enzyme